MRPCNKTRRSRNANVVASAAGGVLGTALAAFASGLPNSSPYKSILTISAPSLAVGLSGVWLFIKAVYIDPYVQEKRRAAKDAAVEKMLADARRKAEAVVNDPNSSTPHIKEIRKIIEKAETEQIQKIAERIKVATIDQDEPDDRDGGITSLRNVGQQGRNEYGELDA